MVNGTPRRRPWLLIALVASIGLNLFLGSWVAGRLLAGPPMFRHAATGERGGPARSVIDRMAASISAEHRATFEAVMARHREPIADAASRAREARDNAREAVASEPFDRAALDKAFETLRMRNDALQSATQSAMAEAAAALPPEARKQLADWRARSRRR
jgi:uncharacterized membrane protein